MVVTSIRYRDRTPSLAGGPHEILYDGSIEADLRFTSSVLYYYIILRSPSINIWSLSWKSAEISSSYTKTFLNTPEWQQKIKSTLNITISTTTFAKLKTFFISQIATRGGFASISPPTGMCYKIQTTYAHDDTRLDIIHVACVTSVETGICPTGGVWTSKPEYVYIGGRYPQCVRAAKRGERRRSAKQCKVQ